MLRHRRAFKPFAALIGLAAFGFSVHAMLRGDMLAYGGAFCIMVWARLATA